MAGERMIKAMQNVAGGIDMPGIVRGIVLSEAPLIIRVETGLELTEDFLELSPLCREKTITRKDITELPHSHVYPPGSTSAEISGIISILIWRGLQIGDNVLMLKYSNGKMYYVLQREGGY